MSVMKAAVGICALRLSICLDQETFQLQLLELLLNQQNSPRDWRHLLSVEDTLITTQKLESKHVHCPETLVSQRLQPRRT